MPTHPHFIFTFWPALVEFVFFKHVFVFYSYFDTVTMVLEPVLCPHPPLYIHSCCPAHYSNVQKQDTMWGYVCTLYTHCGIRMMYTLYSDVAKRRIPSLRSAEGRCVSNVKSHILACYCENFQGNFARFDLPGIFLLPRALMSACLKITFHTQLVN